MATGGNEDQSVRRLINHFRSTYEVFTGHLKYRDVRGFSYHIPDYQIHYTKRPDGSVPWWVELMKNKLGPTKEAAGELMPDEFSRVLEAQRQEMGVILGHTREVPVGDLLRARGYQVVRVKLAVSNSIPDSNHPRKAHAYFDRKNQRLIINTRHGQFGWSGDSDQDEVFMILDREGRPRYFWKYPQLSHQLFEIQEVNIPEETLTYLSGGKLKGVSSEGVLFGKRVAFGGKKSNEEIIKHLEAAASGVKGPVGPYTNRLRIYEFYDYDEWIKSKEGQTHFNKWRTELRGAYAQYSEQELRDFHKHLFTAVDPDTNMPKYLADAYNKIEGGGLKRARMEKVLSSNNVLDILPKDLADPAQKALLLKGKDIHKLDELLNAVLESAESGSIEDILFERGLQFKSVKPGPINIQRKPIEPTKLRNRQQLRRSIYDKGLYARLKRAGILDVERFTSEQTGKSVLTLRVVVPERIRVFGERVNDQMVLDLGNRIRYHYPLGALRPGGTPEAEATFTAMVFSPQGKVTPMRYLGTPKEFIGEVSPEEIISEELAQADISVSGIGGRRRFGRAEGAFSKKAILERARNGADRSKVLVAMAKVFDTSPHELLRVIKTLDEAEMDNLVTAYDMMDPKKAAARSKLNRALKEIHAKTGGFRVTAWEEEVGRRYGANDRLVRRTVLRPEAVDWISSTTTMRVSRVGEVLTPVDTALQLQRLINPERNNYNLALMSVHATESGEGSYYRFLATDPMGRPLMGPYSDPARLSKAISQRVNSIAKTGKFLVISSGELREAVEAAAKSGALKDSSSILAAIEMIEQRGKEEVDIAGRKLTRMGQVPYESNPFFLTQRFAQDIHKDVEPLLKGAPDYSTKPNDYYKYAVTVKDINGKERTVYVPDENLKYQMQGKFFYEPDPAKHQINTLLDYIRTSTGEDLEGVLVLDDIARKGGSMTVLADILKAHNIQMTPDIERRLQEDADATLRALGISQQEAIIGEIPFGGETPVEHRVRGYLSLSKVMRSLDPEASIGMTSADVLHRNPGVGPVMAQLSAGLDDPNIYKDYHRVLTESARDATRVAREYSRGNKMISEFRAGAAVLREMGAENMLDDVIKPIIF